MALVGWGVERKKAQGYLRRSFLALSAAKKSEKELVEMKWPREGWGEEERSREFSATSFPGSLISSPLGGRGCRIGLYLILF